MSAVIAQYVDESGAKFSRETIGLGIPQGKHITDTKRGQKFRWDCHLIVGSLGGC